MTDKDRYGTSIGKGFDEKVRPVLCSQAEEFELEAPEITARYILKQLRKDVDLRKLLPEIRRSLKEQRTFFDGQDLRQQFEQRLTGSVGGEHLLECLVRGVGQGRRFTDIIRDLTDKAVSATATVWGSSRTSRMMSPVTPASIGTARLFWSNCIAC